jgi:serine/threonine protein kinase
MKCYKCSTPIPDNSHFCSTCGADVSGDSHARDSTIAIEQDPQLFSKLQAELGDEYILEKELGRGGMAIVYLGRDARLGRKVAVKVLPPELTYGSKGSTIERFKREAQTAAKLDHPNIIPVYRVAPGGTLFWYVMKYLDGEPLDRILEREGQLTVERTVSIVSQVAEALDYAHQNQVVHRDVKPANVVVDKKGRVTVTDFGIAKALDANTLTASGSIIGTPYYMSPEQCKGKRVGPGADQYSLAVMTYQMLGGHVPFTGDSAVEIVHKHVADPVPPLSILRPQLPEKVVAVVERGLAKTPEQRFSTVVEFAKTLKAVSEGIDVHIAPPTKPEPIRISKTALVSPVPGVLRTAKGKWREKRSIMVIGAGLIVALAAVGAGLFLRSRTQPSVQTSPTASAAQPTAGAPQPAQAAAPETAAARGAPPSMERPAATTRPTARKPTEAGRVPQATNRRARQAAAAPSRQTAPPAGRQAAGQQPPAQVTPQAAAKQEAPRAAAQQPAQAAPATAAVGHLYLGTNPVSTIYVNGVAKGSRLVNVEVPAGTVRLRFQVTDSTGVWWAQDLVVTVAPGETKNLRYVKLVRP